MVPKFYLKKDKYAGNIITYTNNIYFWYSYNKVILPVIEQLHPPHGK